MGDQKDQKNKKKMTKAEVVRGNSRTIDNFEKVFQNVSAIDNIAEIKGRTDNVNDNNNSHLEEIETFGLDLLPVEIVVDDEESQIERR